MRGGGILKTQINLTDEPELANHNAQVEISSHTNRILMNIGHSTIMLCKTYHRHEIEFCTVLSDDV